MLIAVEGIDASGKNTQAELIRQQAVALGISSSVLSFPRYGSTNFSKAVADYLNGRYGDLESVDAHLSALLFAGDRFESKGFIQETFRTHGLVVLDRYVASNLAYQAARVHVRERAKFIDWLSKIEYEVFGMPRADLTILLDVPIEHASKMLLTKGQRRYTESKADLHERDTVYLERCMEIFSMLAESGDHGLWLRIKCTSSDGDLLPVADIGKDIWGKIEKYLRLSPHFRIAQP